MKRMLLFGLVVVVAVAMDPQADGSIAMLPAHSVSPPSPAAVNSAILDQYCSACHDDDLRSGGFALSELDLEQPGETAERFETVILKLNAGMMPPPGMPRPEAGVIDDFIAGVEGAIDTAAAADPNPGRPILHRLNRTEYSNAVRDLLGVEIDAESYLPPDDMSEGYDNMSDVLTISPALLESYMVTAGKISRMAVGDPEAAPVVDTYVVPQAVSQMRHVPGAPFGTRGGTVVRHNFPADGEYTFWMSFYYASIGPLFGDNIPAEGEQIEVAIDGVRVALLDIPRQIKTVEDVRTEPIKVTAGPHDVSATFIERGAGPVEDFVMPFERVLVDLSTGHFPGLTGLPHLRNLGINGPYNVTGVSPIPSHEKIFVCRPADDSEETSCARHIVSKLARLAFRRPLTDQDVEPLISYFRSGREQGDFDAGIRLALQAILADPEFLFRFERDPEGAEPGTNHRITDLELASRLSYFLWSSAPDDELITIAADRQLSDPTILEQQVRRMLEHPKAETLSTNFASHWLRLQNLKDIHPDAYLFPDWDYNLTRSMRRETELFFNSIVREDRTIIDLLDADYTFVDGRLARHYDVPNVVGSRFRRVGRANSERRGLLGQGSILTLTSMANREVPSISV